MKEKKNQRNVMCSIKKKCITEYVLRWNYVFWNTLNIKLICRNIYIYLIFTNSWSILVNNKTITSEKNCVNLTLKCKSIEGNECLDFATEYRIPLFVRTSYPFITSHFDVIYIRFYFDFPFVFALFHSSVKSDLSSLS